MEQEFWERMTKATPLTQLTKIKSFDNIIKLEENIWVIKNFASSDIISAYTNFINTVPEEDWWKNNTDWWVGKYINNKPEIESAAQTLRDDLKKILADDVYLGAFGSIHRLKENFGMFIHTDNPTEKRDLYNENNEVVGTNPGVNNYAILASVLYLSEFNGGELYFPQLGIEYHGEVGDLIIFPGTGAEYDHGVRKVKAGPIRYITTAFGYDKRVEKLKENKYVFEDLETGEFVDIEPGLIENDPNVTMNMEPRYVE
jgi:hypothetical protein